MLITHQHPHNKSLMVGLIGMPNVGKSTLVNTLLGMDLAAVTHLPQTTRNKFQVVLKIDHTEIILVDTPGLHKSAKEINKRMNAQAREGNEGIDLHLIMVDLCKDPIAQIQQLQQLIQIELGKSWLVFTKSDRLESVPEESLQKVFELAKENYFPGLEQHFIISAQEEDNIHLLTGALCDAAIPGPHLYPGDRVSNKNERFFAAEYIREQAFQQLKDELPYELAVVVDDYFDMKKLREDNEEGYLNKKGIVSKISASILVNRPSQRAIVVGTKGSVIKEIGSQARKKIEDMVGGPIFLNLHVKVAPKWFKNNRVLEELGLPRAHDSARVWRKPQ